MPQDIRVSPDGKTFYVADMMADGVYVVDGDAFKQIGFIPTGIGTHGLYPSRDGNKLYVANRGIDTRSAARRGGKGSVSVIDFATEQGRCRPGRSRAAAAPTWATSAPTARRCGCPAATTTWSTRIDTTTGAVDKIPVGREPHGLTVWPQPGRYSLGHTGNMR